MTLRIELDPDCVARYTALAHHVATTHTAMGRIVDESLQEAPYGQEYTDMVYALYVDLHYQVTGDKVSPRTIRQWRDNALKYTKHDLLAFEVLPDSVRLEAVKLSDDLAALAKTSPAPKTPVEICQIAMDEQIATIPALRHRILGEQADELLAARMLTNQRAQERYAKQIPDTRRDSLCGHCKFYDRCIVDVHVYEPRPLLLPCEIDSPAHREWAAQSGVLGRMEA